MSTAPHSVHSPQQYLQLERASQTRNEFFAGEIFAMTGASRTHNLIAGNLFSGIHSQLRGRSCEVYMADMRIKVAASGLYTYPDVVATCEQPKFEDDVLDTLLNPQVIVEVTKSYDRGKKFEHYRRLPSLQHYILVAQNRCHIEKYTRTTDGQWLLWETSQPSDTLHIESIDCSLIVSDIYERVSFADEPTRSAID